MSSSRECVIIWDCGATNTTASLLGTDGRVIASASRPTEVEQTEDGIAWPLDDIWGNLCELTLQTPNGQMRYDGDARIDGVLGTSAPVVCTYMDIAGSACGSLLPTGQIRDTVNGIEVSCVDNGMPVVVLRAADLGITGYEPAAELTANVELKAALEAVMG